MMHRCDHRRLPTVVSGILLFVVMSVVLAGCSPAGSSSLGTSEQQKDAVASAEPTRSNAAEINAPNVPDFREWCTKKSSLAEAEKSLGAKVRAPKETRGGTLKAIYVGETYPDGSAVDKWDKEALLDYGDFVVLIAPRPSAEAAASHVEGAGNPLSLATGLYRQCTVRGKPAYVRKKGTVTAKVDSSGKTVRPGMTSTESVVYFSAGNEAVLVFSELLSEDDVLAIAESIDFD